MADTGSQKAEFNQEIRFAVVIYGGSSLAIYMNGVAQELLHLVRSTAPERSDWNKLHFPEVSGTERIYREVGRMLHRGEAPKVNLAADDAVKTRFVIDVLSGTSAGGINSVFLAKALVNDLSLDTLRDVWLNTADFGVLLNDSQGTGQRQKPPHSLVNSPFLYQEIFKALKAMDDPGRNVLPSPYTDQLDLFTTFTDIQGQTITLKLADLVATERQHLHNFHFVYTTAEAVGEDRNDFTDQFNPFLAFAARSTSAHPAAFEPMTLEDIAKAGCNPESTAWRKFYYEYLQPVRVQTQTSSDEPPTPDDLAKEFLTRPLSDGGVLDNSPFSFAINQLDFRNVRMPVDRKLLYVEPSPSHPELQQDTNEKPDALTNALISLSTLPSYQFIRDDIRRILDRNALIERVNRILMGIEADFASRHTRLTSFTGESFGAATIDQLIEVMGPSWGGYQRLRVAETTDDLVTIVARAAGFSDDADEFMAIQYLVRAWRNEHFAVRPPAGNKTVLTENRFLYYFDLRRHIRRLKFIIKKANELSCFDNHANDIVRTARPDAVAVWQNTYSDPAFTESARQELKVIIKQLSEVLKELYMKQRALTAPVLNYRNVQHPLAASIAGLNIDRSMLTGLLEHPGDKRRLEVATKFVNEREQQFNSLAADLIKEFQIIRTASRMIKGEGEDFAGQGVLQLPTDAVDAAQQVLTPVNVPRFVLRYFYDHFDHYDMVSYPIIYSTSVGEELDTVEVFRIGPEDSSSPIDNMEERKQKLAGTALANFGALLDRPYRTNDIIWGRLDCADRLITALLRSAPPPADKDASDLLEKKRVQLIREAQQAIIVEEAARFDEQTKEELGLASPEVSSGEIARRAAAAGELEQANLAPAVKEYLASRLSEEDPLERFVKNFKRLHRENPRKLLETAGRASHILGQMLDDIADRHRLQSPHLTWITRLMRIFWGLVEVSLPDTWQHLITKHLLELLYFLEILMIVGGVVFANDAIQRFGILSFGITLAVNCFIFILRDFTLSQKGWMRGTLALLGAGTVLAAMLGIAVLAGVLGVDLLWSVVQYLHDLVAGNS